METTTALEHLSELIGGIEVLLCDQHQHLAEQ